MDSNSYLKLKTENNLYRVKTADIVQNRRDFSTNSEAIVKDIIEKILSYTITEAFQYEIERKIPGKCWNYMHKLLDDFIHLEFIPHDRDDMNLKNDFFDDIFQEKKIFSKNSLEKVAENSEENFDTLENLINDKSDMNDNIIEFNPPHVVFDELKSEKLTIYFDAYFDGINQWNTVLEPVMFY
jgi:hypothetical protein